MFWRVGKNNLWDCINSCELIDLGFNGPTLTWNNLREGGARVRKRLDRALCNEEWRIQFPEAAVTHLAWAHSDHHPLLLEVAIRGKKPAGPKPFRFELAWLTHLDFMEEIERC